MKIKTVALSASLFLAGLFAGGAGASWSHARDWNQWLMDFNLYPLMAEVTYGLKELRAGKATRLQATLEETAWRNIGVLAQQLANGDAMPTHVESALRCHCAHNQTLANSPAASIQAARAKLCDPLLSYYLQQSQANGKP